MGTLAHSGTIRVLIDWITARLPMEFMGEEQFKRRRKLGDRIQRYSANDGEIRWESQAWYSIRSDSHQIAMRVGSDALWIQGSPARVIGNGCTVFGNGASQELDAASCLQAMISHVSNQAR